MSKITRFDLADGLYKSSDLKWADAQKLVTILVDSLAEALAKGERIELRGFGSFVFQFRRAGQRRKPRTGEAVQVPDRWVARFKPAKELRELLSAMTPEPRSSEPPGMLSSSKSHHDPRAGR